MTKSPSSKLESATCSVTALPLAMKHGRSKRNSLENHCETFKDCKSRNYVTNSKRSTGAKKYASFRHCILKKICPQHPLISFITHTIHHIHHKSLIRVLIMTRAALHAIDQVLRRDLATHGVSPPK